MVAWQRWQAFYSIADRRYRFSLRAWRFLRHMGFAFCTVKQICFSVHGRAPRWRLRILRRHLRLEKLRASHGIAVFFHSCSLRGHRGFAGFDNKSSSGDPSSSSSRPLLMYVKVPDPKPYVVGQI